MAFKFATHPLLGLGRPLVHAGIAQETHFLNQQFLDLIGRLQWTRLAIGDVQDALDSFPHLGVSTELLDELDFGLAKLFLTGVFLIHPHFI